MKRIGPAAVMPPPKRFAAARPSPSTGPAPQPAHGPKASDRPRAAFPHRPDAALAPPALPDKTPSREGMERWLERTVEQLLKLKFFAPGGQVDPRVMNHLDPLLDKLAYRIYEKHDLKQQVAKMSGTDKEQAFAGLDRDFVEQVEHDAANEFSVDWQDVRSGRGRGTVPASTQAKLHQEDVRQQVDNDGVRSRFSVTARPLLRPQDRPAAEQEARTAFKGVTRAMARYATTVEQATSGKVMRPPTLAKQRMDHAVGYASWMRSDAEIDAVAQALAGDLHDPHPRPLLGMEPRAPGVSYGEEHRERIDAQGRRHPPYGFAADEKAPGSFGKGRAVIIRTAIREALEEDPVHLDTLAQRALGKLDGALERYGYDKRTPALVDRDLLRAD